MAASEMGAAAGIAKLPANATAPEHSTVAARTIHGWDGEEVAPHLPDAQVLKLRVLASNREAVELHRPAQRTLGTDTSHDPNRNAVSSIPNIAFIPFHPVLS